MNMRTRERESSQSPSMAEKLAEDDDDEGFGDFKFAPYSTPQTNHAHASAADGCDDGDDEWGDFVNNSSPAQISNGNPPPGSFTRTQSLPTSSDPSRIFDPFGSISGKSSVSMPAAPWVKPRGALPLSIFGGVDEVEEGSDYVETNHKIRDFNNISAQKQGSKVGVAINDVIEDLYGQMEQSKTLVRYDLGLKGANTNCDSAVNGSDSNKAKSNVNGFQMGMGGLNLESVDGDGGFKDDDGWEFKGADMGTKEHSASGLRALKVQFPISNQEMQAGQEDSDGVLHASGFEHGNGEHVSTDLFSMSNGFTEKASEFDTRLYPKPIITTQNGLVPDSYNKGMGSAAENRVESHLVGENLDSDDDIWEFKDATASTRSKHEEVWAFEDVPVGTNLKQEEEPKAADISTGEVQAFTSCETPENKINSENNKGALPLSIFSEGIPDTEDSFNSQDIFIYTPTSSKKGYNAGSNMPINDLILNLYSQTEGIYSNDSTQKPAKNGLNSPLYTDLMNSDTKLEDRSWEFKDAFSKIKDEDRNSTSLQNRDGNSIAIFQLNDYVDLYTHLKEQLCFVVQHHIDTHMSNNGSALSETEGEVVASDEEFEEASKILRQYFPENVSLDSYPSRNIDLKEFLEVLNQPKFLVLDSEYQLSGRLLLAEKDLKAAVELLKHAAVMLKVPKLGSIEEQSSYVFAWLKVASTCAQELKHGALIWKQSLEKNLHGQLLCKAPGQSFIHALGEIYRVSRVLGASSKLYKPWMLLGHADFAEILALLDECSTLWSSSGLQEALQSISHPTSLDHDGTTVSALLRSIEHIRDLDALSLQSHVFSQPEPMCKFSLLTPGAVPGMKMVDWNGEQYLLAVANLWANLISCEPPKLAHLSTYAVA